jgi:hypothetical protein
LRLAIFFERTARLAMVFERTARLAIFFDSATGAAAATDLGDDFVVAEELFSGLKLLVSDFFWIGMIVLLRMFSDQLELLFAGCAIPYCKRRAKAVRCKNTGNFEDPKC